MPADGDFANDDGGIYRGATWHGKQRGPHLLGGPRVNLLWGQGVIMQELALEVIEEYRSGSDFARSGGPSNKYGPRPRCQGSQPQSIPPESIDPIKARTGNALRRRKPFFAYFFWRLQKSMASDETRPVDLCLLLAISEKSSTRAPVPAGSRGLAPLGFMKSLRMIDP